MPIIQPLLELPTDLALRIATGELRLDGGVVRSVATGQIVKHLNDAAPAKKAQEGAQAVAARATNLPRTTVVAVGSLVVVAVAGTAVWAWRRTQASKAANDQRVDLESALAAYLGAAREGRLDVSLIRQLITSIDEATAKDEASPTTLPADDATALVNAVAEHTRQLAAANKVEMPAELEGPAPDTDPLGQLRYYLRVQEQIFTSAA